ncbi:MAG: GNAT family N-acetyltransferase [Actinobacteria bacterium]|nr:GNAT family N-acetyltransferase [Actinomycetota bacterium]
MMLGQGGAAGLGVLIRRAVPSDLEQLLILGERYCAADRAAWLPQRARAGFKPLLRDDTHGIVLVVEATDALIGYAVLTWGWSIEAGGRESLLDEMYIDQPSRGYGSLLIEEVVAAAQAHGAVRVFLETEGVNSAARRFWLKRGFELEDSIWLQRRW